MYRTDFWTLWEKARVGCFKRTASKHVYYLRWNRSPAQVGCMRQVLGPGALGRPRGIGRRGRWEGVSGWEIHVKPWLILVNVRQKPLQYCGVISLQLIKKKKKDMWPPSQEIRENLRGRTCSPEDMIRNKVVRVLIFPLLELFQNIQKWHKVAWLLGPAAW